MPSWDNQRKTWRAQVKHNGQRYRKGFQTKREAKEWETQKKKELRDEARRSTPTGMDLLSFFNKYLDYVRLHFVDKTYKNKKRLCERLTACFGNIPVSQVTSMMIEDYLQSQALSRSKAGYNEDYKHLRSMWTWGGNFLELPSNPVAKLRRIPADRSPQYTPSTEDVLKVLAAANRDERVFLNCYLQTGARRSEIFRWTWIDDINFEKREVRLTTRKTKDGSEESEWLPMNDELYEGLLWWWRHRPVKNSEYVFANTNALHYGKKYTKRGAFLPGLCKRAGVKPFGFHAMRRYVASVLADTHKVSSKQIQRILRHKHVTTTERYIQNINHDLSTTMNLLCTKGPQEGSPSTLEKQVTS